MQLWIRLKKLNPRRLLKTLKKPNRIIVLVDIENLLLSLEKKPLPEEFSLMGGFDRLIKDIAREIGEIVDIYVFGPQHLVYTHAEAFYKAGFWSVVCPKTRNKQGEEVDTTDAELMRYGESAIENVKGLTHLCIASGDRDFSPLVRKAIRRGLKIIVIAASLKSLSSELAKLADRIEFYSPTE